MARRDPRAGIDDYIARLWCVINSYPLNRRPVWIAANLSMDTVKAVSRAHRWMGRAISMQGAKQWKDTGAQSWAPMDLTAVKSRSSGQPAKPNAEARPW